MDPTYFYGRHYDLVCDRALSLHAFGLIRDRPFGARTPPRDTSKILRSTFVWQPDRGYCSKNYTCIYCDKKRAKNSNCVFLLKKSLSRELHTCASCSCKTFYGKNTKRFCGNFSAVESFSQTSCPIYEIEYGSEITKGLLLSRSLNLQLEDRK